MNFKVVQLQAQEPFLEILQAELAELGFDAFMEIENGFQTAIDESLFQQADFEQVIAQYAELTHISYQLSTEEKKNWNKEWEENFQPIVVSDKCLIRADFHPAQPQYPYEIVINPKMSFGTGHHQTTRLMIQNQFEIEHQGKEVLDLGCGTGILGIMAGKLGASSVTGCDIDEWAVENTLENAQINAVPFEVKVATAKDFLGEKTYPIVLANINLHVLLDEMPHYAALTAKDGHLLLSGFYTQDVPKLRNLAESLGFRYLSQREEKNWVSMILKRVGS